MISRDYHRVGLIQLLLASGFVLWLVFLPGFGSKFAWPINDQLTAMFIGTAFTLRAFEGYFMWRAADWYRLRWMSWGTMAFLVVIFAATYWHIDLMNWNPFNLATYIWMFAYTGEPLVVPFVEPHGAEAATAVPKTQQRGALTVLTQNVLLVIIFVAAVCFGMLFINPAKFAVNVWPWPLTAFDARMISAFFAGIIFWAARMKTLADWAEVRMGVQGLILFFGGHFVVWIFNLLTGHFDLSRAASIYIYGAVTGLLAIALLVSYFQQEKK